jgi:signal transduction histidine kinase
MSDNLEKDFFSYFEHETITHLSVVCHEIDDIRFQINKTKIKALELSKIIDRITIQENVSQISNELYSELDYWLNRLQIARFELDSLIHFIRTPNVLDIPKAKYNFDTIKLHQLLRQCILRAEYNTKLRNIELKTNNIIEKVRRTNFLVKIDQLMLQHAFQNLIDNAIKFSEPRNHEIGKSIWLEIEFENIDDEKYFCLSVCNWGCRIPEIFKESIFDKGFKLNFKDKFNFEGKGLGLPICRSIINRMNGDVFLNTKRKDCTEFVIKMPIYDRRIIRENSCNRRPG